MSAPKNGQGATTGAQYAPYLPFFFAILVRVILSWVAPDPYHPFAAIMTQVTEPLLGPVRKVLPNLGGLDLSPLVVLLGLQFLMVLFAL